MLLGARLVITLIADDAKALACYQRLRSSNPFQRQQFKVWMTLRRPEFEVSFQGDPTGTSESCESCDSY